MQPTFSEWFRGRYRPIQVEQASLLEEVVEIDARAEALRQALLADANVLGRREIALETERLLVDDLVQSIYAGQYGFGVLGVLNGSRGNGAIGQERLARLVVLSAGRRRRNPDLLLSRARWTLMDIKECLEIDVMSPDGQICPDPADALRNLYHDAKHCLLGEVTLEHTEGVEYAAAYNYLRKHPDVLVDSTPYGLCRLFEGRYQLPHRQ